MKAKQTLLIIVMVFSSLIINAQDKYEFMIIEFTSFSDNVSISIDGKEFLREKVEYLNQSKSNSNANPFLNKVKEYQDKDWEVMNFSSYIMSGSNVNVHYAHLRRKKVDKK